MTKVLTTRYEHFINNGSRTHATTNLMPKAIKNKYGERFFDPDASGCKQLFNVVVFEGQSWRR